MNRLISIVVAIFLVMVLLRIVAAMAGQTIEAPPTPTPRPTATFTPTPEPLPTPEPSPTPAPTAAPMTNDAGAAPDTPTAQEAASQQVAMAESAPGASSAPMRAAGDGEALFGEACAPCHGQDAQGIPGIGLNLRTSDFVGALTPEELAHFVAIGRTADSEFNIVGVPMPPRGGRNDLTDAQLLAIAEYLHSINQNVGKPSPRADDYRQWLLREETQADVLVSLGQTAYLRYCAVCHAPDAQGRPGLGKNLVTSRFVAEQSDADLIAFIRVGRPADDPLNTTGIAMLPYGGQPTLSDADLTNLVAYMRSVNLGLDAIAALPTEAPTEVAPTKTPTPAAVAEAGGDTAAAGAIDGAAVFARLNPPCLTCHQLGGKGSKFGPGPNLDGLKDVAATRVEGLSAEEYVHQSIVEPSAFVVKQCPAGPCVNAMPKNYADQMTAEELDALVQYLLNH
ncbi:MAG: c-type cytochrome [Caldilinea sp.]